MFRDSLKRTHTVPYKYCDWREIDLLMRPGESFDDVDTLRSSTYCTQLPALFSSSLLPRCNRTLEEDLAIIIADEINMSDIDLLQIWQTIVTD